MEPKEINNTEKEINLMIEESIAKVTLHKAITCKESDTVQDVSQKLKDNKERRIFVVDKFGKLTGIITTTDIVYKAFCDGKYTSSLKAEDIMEKNVKFVEASEDLDKALEVMNDLKTFTCPMTKDGELLGVISYHDLMNYIIKSLK